MIRRFIKDLGIYGISSFISKGISIFLVPFYTRIFTPSDYGTIDIMIVVGSFVSVSFPLQITQAVARFISDDKGSKRNIDLVSSIGFIFTIFSFSIFLLISLVFSKYFTILLLEDIKYQYVFKLASINIFIYGLYYFVQNQLRWTLKPVKYSIVSITYIAITIPLTIFLVLFFHLKLEGVFYAKIIGAFVSFILGWYFSKDNYYFLINTKKFKEMLQFSLPLVPSSLGVFFINSSQKIIIKALMSLADLGLFGVGTRLASIVNIGFQNIKTALIPIIYQKQYDKNTPQSLANLFNWMILLLLLIIVSISIFSQEIIHLLTTPIYYSAYIIVPFLLMDMCFNGLTDSFTPGLAIVKKTKIIAILNIIGAIISVGLSYFCIKFIGLIGAAIAGLLKSFSIFIMQLYFSQKYYYIPYNFKKPLLSLILSFPFISLGMMFFSKTIWIYLIKFGLILFYILFVIFIIKIIDYKHLFVLIKSINKKP